MPFISKDWRSPGEAWVRYDGGWELKRTISVNQKPSEDSDPTAATTVRDSIPLYGILMIYRTKIYRTKIY
jgi:F-box protein 25/32